jgi:hypothetical protein
VFEIVEENSAMTKEEIMVCELITCFTNVKTMLPHEDTLKGIQRALECGWILEAPGGKSYIPTTHVCPLVVSYLNRSTNPTRFPSAILLLSLYCMMFSNTEIQKKRNNCQC